MQSSYPNQMASDFGQFLDLSMRNAGWSQLTFAQRVGVNQGFLSRVIAGSRNPPLDALPIWVDALGLAPDEADEFIRRAYLSHCPQWVQSYVESLEEQLRVAEKSLDNRTDAD